MIGRGLTLFLFLPALHYRLNKNAAYSYVTLRAWNLTRCLLTQIIDIIAVLRSVNHHNRAVTLEIADIVHHEVTDG